jgi:HKD family nuclease
MMEKNFKPLQKGKKDILQMMGPEPEQHHHEFANWASKALPNQNWQTWAARHYKNKPEDFTPEVKQELEHFGGSTHIPEVYKVRFDKQHDLHTGMKMFQQAYDQYNNRIKENKNLVKPTEKTQKVVEGAKPNRHWFGLGVGACENEGKAMGHCGNVPSEVEGDELLSLRTEHKIKNQIYHEPHLTFVVNNGFLGEMKGRANTKPSKEYHRDITNLLKNPNIKGVIGGGYAPENNFEFNDLSPELQREVKEANPDLITSVDDDLDKIISKKDIFPEKHRHILSYAIENPNLDPKHHEKLVNDERPYIRQAIAQNPNLDPKYYEKLVNHKDESIRLAIAENPNLDPKYHEKFVNDEEWSVRQAIAQNPNLDQKYHEKLVNDEEWSVRHVIAQHPNLDPKYHEKLMNDENSPVRFAIIRNPNLDPKHHEKFVNDKDSGIREAIAENPNLDTKHQEKLVNDKYSDVRRAIALNPNLDPKYHEKLVNDNDPYVRQNLEKNPSYKKYKKVQLKEEK